MLFVRPHEQHARRPKKSFAAKPRIPLINSYEENISRIAIPGVAIPFHEA